MNIKSPTEQEKLFSQADPRIVQRPPGFDAEGGKQVVPAQRPDLEEYSGARATPGRVDENHVATNAGINVGGKTVLIDKDLGFQAHSVVIQNWTNQMLEIEGAHQFIPPYSGGWVVPMVQGSQQGRIALRNPSTAMAALAAPLAGEYVWALFCEAFLPPQSGVSITNPANLSPSGSNEVVIIDDAGNELLLNTGAILGGLSGTGSIPVDTPGEWSITNAPAANTIATITRAAAGGVRHVARGITGDLVAGALAPAAISVLLVLRDGAAGVGAIIWSRYLALSAVAGDKDDTTSPPLNIVGTLGNAMTLEFTAAGGANTLEAVSLNGYDIT